MVAFTDAARPGCRPCPGRKGDSALGAAGAGLGSITSYGCDGEEGGRQESGSGHRIPINVRRCKPALGGPGATLHGPVRVEQGAASAYTRRFLESGPAPHQSRVRPTARPLFGPCRPRRSNPRDYEGPFYGSFEKQGRRTVSGSRKHRRRIGGRLVGRDQHHSGGVCVPHHQLDDDGGGTMEPPWPTAKRTSGAKRSSSSNRNRSTPPPRRARASRWPAVGSPTSPPARASCS